MWKVIGASVTGTSHEAVRKECEDASGWHVHEDMAALAVADGAGSRPLGGRGAGLAVAHALALVRGCALRPERDDPAAVMRLVFSGVRDQIAATALAESNDVSQYAATLAVVTLTSDTVCVGQIGDTIVVLGCDREYEVVEPAPRWEYVNETNFVTDANALERVRITVRPGDAVDAVFLSTDGMRFKILGDLAETTPFTPFFEDLQAYACSPESDAAAIRQFLAGVDDQSGDDKTLVAAVLADLSG